MNTKEITSTLTAPGTVRTAVGRDVWSKILAKTSVNKLVYKGGCFKDRAMFNRKLMHCIFSNILEYIRIN